MDNLRTDDLMHRQALEILPWYVRRQLGPEESRKMDAHLAACPACRREAAGLTRLFTVQEQSIPDRPVDEKRLDALFARIDAFEAEQPRSRQRTPERPARSLMETLMGWLTAKPVLVGAGALAVAFAVMLSFPVAKLEQKTGEYGVLSNGASKEVKDPFRMTIRLKTEQDATQLTEMIDVARASGLFHGEYRIDRRSGTEYTVVFEEKPSVCLLYTSPSPRDS